MSKIEENAFQHKNSCKHLPVYTDQHSSYVFMPFPFCRINKTTWRNVFILNATVKCIVLHALHSCTGWLQAIISLFFSRKKSIQQDERDHAATMKDSFGGILHIQVIKNIKVFFTNKFRIFQLHGLIPNM